MRGHVIKRGKKWSFVVDAPREEAVDDDGRAVRLRRQKWYSGYATKKAAEIAMTEILGSINKQAYVAPDKVTVAAYLAEWLQAQAREDIRPSTLASYRQLMETYVIPRIGMHQLQSLSSAHIDALYTALLAGGRKQRAGGLSPRTVHYVHVVLRKALAHAARMQRVARNVADDVKAPPSRVAAVPRTWSGAELRAFLEHVEGDRLHAAWVLAASTGMRRGEVLGLRWSDVDLEAGRVSITQTVIAVGYKVSFSTPKTDNGRRSVALDPAVVNALRAHRVRQAEERLAAATYADLDLVFARPDGSPLHPDNFSQSFDNHVRAVGLPRIRLHDLRHTHATLALQAGVHPLVVSKRLGHGSVTVTLDVYSHAIPEMQEEAAARVAAVVWGA